MLADHASDALAAGADAQLGPAGAIAAVAPAVIAGAFIAGGAVVVGGPGVAVPVPAVHGSARGKMQGQRGQDRRARST